MTLEQLAAIRERANNATKGPWEHIRDSNYQLADCPPTYESLVTSDDGMVAILDWGNGATSSDAEFIAHARTDIPALLDHIKVQASVIEALNAGVNNALSAKIHAVRKLHTSVKPDSDGEHYLDPLTRKPKCGECLLIYPCPTIQALEGDPDGSQ